METKDCPYCLEQIKKKATKCKWCASDVRLSTRISGFGGALVRVGLTIFILSLAAIWISTFKW